MKAVIKIEKEIEVNILLIDIGIDFVGDADDDDMPADFPLLNEGKDRWVAKIDIDTGKIISWPKGEVREMYIKVRDDGNYKLFDDKNNEVDALMQEYVPNRLVPGEYGDYIDLKIDGDGFITNWSNKPDLSDFPKFARDDD